jgi:hypothetical protein
VNASGRVRIVAVSEHRIDAQVTTVDHRTGIRTIRLSGSAVRDLFGWSVVRRRPGKTRITTRVDGLPEFLARRVIAARLAVADL